MLLLNYVLQISNQNIGHRLHLTSHSIMIKTPPATRRIHLPVVRRSQLPPDNSLIMKTNQDTTTVNQAMKRVPYRLWNVRQIADKPHQIMDRTHQATGTPLQNLDRPHQITDKSHRATRKLQAVADKQQKAMGRLQLAIVKIHKVMDKAPQFMEIT